MKKFTKALSWISLFTLLFSVCALGRSLALNDYVFKARDGSSLVDELWDLSDAVYDANKEQFECFLTLIHAYGEIRAVSVMNEATDQVAEELRGSTMGELAAFVKQHHEELYRRDLANIQDSILYDQSRAEMAAGSEKERLLSRVEERTRIMNELKSRREQQIQEYSCLELHNLEINTKGGVGTLTKVTPSQMPTTVIAGASALSSYSFTSSDGASLAVELRSLNQELFKQDRTLWKCFSDVLFAFGDLHGAPGVYDRGEIPDAVAEMLHGMSVLEMVAFVKRSKEDYYHDLISELEDSVKYNQVLLDGSAGEDKAEYQRKINLYQKMIADMIEERDRALAQYSCLDE